MKTLLSQGLIQVQIEFNSSPKQCKCWTCSHSFEMQTARVSVCDARGDRYGEICPSCIAQGSDWLAARCQQLTQFKPPMHPKQINHSKNSTPTAKNLVNK